MDIDFRRTACRGCTIRGMDELMQEIAACAARLVVEEGLEYGAAKRRAVKSMRLPQRAALPNNDLIEQHVFEYIDMFCAETQPQELLALRRHALQWMGRLQEFRPYLSGAVWRGTATRLSDIYLQLFCDDPKSTEIALINMNLSYDVTTVKGFQGEAVDALSLHSVCPELEEDIGIHLMIYDHDDVRGALKRDEKGRSVRGDLSTLNKLIEDGCGHEDVRRYENKR